MRSIQARMDIITCKIGFTVRPGDQIVVWNGECFGRHNDNDMIHPSVSKPEISKPEKKNITPSQYAAKRIQQSGRLPNVQSLILSVMIENPYPADVGEIAKLANRDKEGISSRMSELIHMGAVVRVGEYRPFQYLITEHGRELFWEKKK